MNFLTAMTKENSKIKNRLSPKIEVQKNTPDEEEFPHLDQPYTLEMGIKEKKKWSQDFRQALKRGDIPQIAKLIDRNERKEFYSQKMLLFSNFYLVFAAEENSNLEVLEYLAKRNPKTLILVLAHPIDFFQRAIWAKNFSAIQLLLKGVLRSIVRMGTRVIPPSCMLPERGQKRLLNSF